MIPLIITSADNQKFRSYLRLKQKKYRYQTGLFLAEGPHLVNEAAKARRLEAVVSTEPFTDIKVDNLVVSASLFASLSDVETPQGVIGICKMADNVLLGDRILMLDGISDPGNLGTLIRSAKAFGFKTFVFENIADPYSPKVVRATQGAIFGLGFLKADLIEFIGKHREYEYVGTDVKTGLPLSEFNPNGGKLALILGNEANGVREEILNKTGVNIKIEMDGMESLNVGVAGGILMYALRRK